MDKDKKRIPIEKIILATLATVGILAAVMIAPGIGPVLRMFGLNKNKYSRQYVGNAIYRMKQKGLIQFEIRNGKRFVVLTKKGKDKLNKFRYTGYKIQKPKHWDGKWHIVIFDIREELKQLRNKLRQELRGIGFLKLQNSVWVYPYDCEEFIKLLKADYRIGKDILYIVADRVEYDKNIKTFFKI